MKSQLKLKSKFSDKTKAKTITKEKTKTETPSSKKLPLNVDLNRIYNPDPSVELAYKQNNADQYFYWRDRPEFLNESRIWSFANAEGPNRPKREIKHRIQSIYRRRVGENEYCFFHEWLGTTDYFNNQITHTRLLGKFDYPIIVQQTGYNPNSAFDPNNAPGPEQLGLSIDNVETRYLWKFENLKPQLIQWKKDGIIWDECVFTAWVGTRKYSVPNWEQFISMDLDSLVLCNRVGEQAIGLTNSKDINKMILQLARETGRERLKKSLSSGPERGVGRKL